MLLIFGDSGKYDYANKLNDTCTIVIAKLISPIKKIISATRSNFSEWVSLLDRIERKERIQLIISSMAASPVISSIKVAAANFEILIDVNTTKQNPSRLEELFKICGDFSVAIYK
jgi:hypothetical protein